MSKDYEVNLDSDYIKILSSPDFSTHGGETQIGDVIIDGYCLNFGHFAVGEFTGEQMSDIGLGILNHLMINNHEFYIKKVNGIQQIIKLKR